MADIHILSDRPRKSSASKARVGKIVRGHIAYLNAQAQADADKEEDAKTKSTLKTRFDLVVVKMEKVVGPDWAIERLEAALAELRAQRLKP